MIPIYSLPVITGAPGSGKSTLVQALHKFETPFAFFDIDWLAAPASALIGTDISSDPTAWQPYSQLWFEVLHASLRNGQRPVFFTPNDPSDFKIYGVPKWIDQLDWLLLDCPDEIRCRRLTRRLHWTTAQTDEALEDAAILRRQVPNVLDTSTHSTSEAAEFILAWLAETKIAA